MNSILTIGVMTVYLGALIYSLLFIFAFWSVWPANFLPLAFCLLFVPGIYSSFFGKPPNYADPEIRKIMEDFAKENNLYFFADALIPSIKSRFLNLSTLKSYKKKDIIEFIYSNFTVRIFDYPYYEGKKGVYRMTISEVSFKKTIFPHILFVGPKVRFFNNIPRYKSDIEIKPSYSKKDFRLYVTKGYQTEALQIFNLDFLEYLNAQDDSLGIEFLDSKLYVFEFKNISDKAYLDNFYNITKKVIDFVGETSNRLHNDFEALDPYYKNKRK